MKNFLIATAILLSFKSFATNTPVPQTSLQQHQTSSSEAAAQSTVNAGSSTYDSNSYKNNLYVLPGGSAFSPAAVPAGLCNRGSSRKFAIGWGFLDIARSDVNDDLDKYVECMRSVVPLMHPPKLPPARAIHPSGKKYYRPALLNCTLPKACYSKEHK